MSTIPQAVTGIVVRAARMAILLCVLACAVAIAAGIALPRTDQLLFMSDRGGNEDLYLMDYERSLVQNLTQNDAQDRHPLWSPDGRWIAFASNRDGRWNLYLMDAVGHGVRRLTDNNTNYRYAAWSPDGQRLAYSSTLFDSGIVRGSFIHVYNMADGGTNSVPGMDGRMVYAPMWSQDGTRIRFYAQRADNTSQYHMKLDGSDVRAISDEDGLVWLPARRLPRAPELGFTSYVTAYAVDICVVDVERKHRDCVTHGEGRNMDPMWRP